jgi:hypothetical protein
LTFYRFGGILEYEGRGADFMSTKPDMSGMDEGCWKGMSAEEGTDLKLFFLGIQLRTV